MLVGAFYCYISKLNLARSALEARLTSVRSVHQEYVQLHVHTCYHGIHGPDKAIGLPQMLRSQARSTIQAMAQAKKIYLGSRNGAAECGKRRSTSGTYGSNNSLDSPQRARQYTKPEDGKVAESRQ